MKILILNGPNLNLLGKREPDVYGASSMEDVIHSLRERFSYIDLEYAQSNVEGELVNLLQQTDADAVVLNAGAYTHTSVALGDCVAAIDTPVIEVHISNVTARESFRHTSYISPHAAGVLFGFGVTGYGLAIQHLVDLGT